MEAHASNRKDGTDWNLSQAGEGRQAGVGGCSRVQAAGPADGRAAAGSSRLDRKAINGSADFVPEDELLIIGCKCRSWCCAKCGPGYFARIGGRITPHLGMFEKPRLLTLTIDRKRFEGGQQAYQLIRSEGYLRRFLRLGGFEKAFSILAFHPKAKDWPHWHLLVDIADCGNWVDLENMWSLWRDKWGIGGLDLNVTGDRGPATAAARYILGYCQHQAGVVAPWVLDGERLPRVFETYGQLRAALRQPAADVQDDSEQTSSGQDGSSDGSATRKRTPSGRPVRERLQDCGSGSTVILRRHGVGGQTSYRFLGSLPVTPGRLALADEMGELRTITIRRRVHELPNGQQTLQVSIPLDGQDAKAILARVESASRVVRLCDQVSEAAALDADLPGDDLAECDQEGGDDVAPF